jgi:alpha-beta hydrolase superfamily lysophospholipase
MIAALRCLLLHPWTWRASGLGSTAYVCLALPGVRLVLLGIGVTGFVFLNLLAWRHARAMTCYLPAGTRTPRPQHLSVREKVGVLFSGVVMPRPEVDARPADWGLSHEVHRIPGPEDLEAWHIPHPASRGAGPRGLVLLFHGYSDCKAEFLDEARAFHDLGFRCLLVDFRGCGGSTGSVTTVGVREADDVLAALAFARRRWPDEPFVLYGRSMGAVAVLRAMTTTPEPIAALVLECPFDRMLNTVKARFAAMGVPAFPSAQLLLFWGSVQRGFNGFTHNPVSYARQVRVPTVILHGSNDAWVTHEQIAAVHDNLAGPRRLLNFPGIGHESIVARVPAEWKACVDQFLTEHVLAADTETWFSRAS